MIRGLCESALTFEAIMVWREELANGRILLREVIDLEQTYGGVNAAGAADDRSAGRCPASRRAAEADAEGDEDGEAVAKAESDDDDDFDDGGGPDLSAMEARAARRRHGDPGRHRRRVRSASASCRKSWSSRRLKGEDLTRRGPQGL